MKQRRTYKQTILEKSTGRTDMWGGGLTVDFRPSCSHHVHDLGVTQRQIPRGSYKGLLKFTSYSAGGMAAPGNLLGRHNTVTSWLCGRAGYGSLLHCPSASCILLICPLYINKPRRPQLKAPLRVCCLLVLPLKLLWS